jgi:hypothetical protein
MYKNTEVNTRVTQKRLAKASQYVNDLWFPVNSELLAKIKLGIRGGIYDLDPESLVNSISGDFSLFMYCLRELISMLKEEDVNIPLANPVEVLRQAGLDRLKQILEIDEQKITKHSYEGREVFQNAQFEEMLISSSAAQALSTSLNINQEIGFSAAILRQLGHTLIAWNYPTVYKQALENITPDTTLDQLIAERLGFSPALLSIRILMDWGFPVAMCEAIFIEEEDEESDEVEGLMQSMLGGNLAKICSIGEALARANNPEIYPNAAKDWEFAKQEITSHLGENGMRFIQEVLHENLEHYITFMPEIFNPGLLVDPELHLAVHNNKLAPSLNPYIQLCTREISEALNAVYALMQPNTVSEKCLTRLVNEVIPAAGFSGGLIFTVDPGIHMLLPQTLIGSLKLKKKQPVDYSVIVSNADSISVAFRSSDPVIEFQADEENEIYTGISGIIGSSNRVGILYLELPYSVFSSDERAQTMAFRAFSKAITDCLDLK